MKKLISSTRLKAKSPRGAFYHLFFLELTDGYIVREESGTGEKVLHTEAWYRESREETLKLYNRILKEKTNPGRRSPRKYQIISELSPLGLS